MIAGIVLAAGQSRRMGRPKALLPLRGATLLEHAVRALAGGGCAPVVVVTGPSTDPVAERIGAVALALGARVAENPVAGSEQVESLRIGLATLGDDVTAAVVLPVDVPGVDDDAVRRVVDAFRRRGAPVVRAVHAGRHGHPVLFARSLFAELMAESLPEGARSVIHAHAARVEEVETGHAGVLHDVDTPEQFRRLADGAA